MQLLKKGDRIRLKVRTILGWKGYGTVSEDQLHADSTVWFSRDGDDPEDIMFGRSAACRHEVAKVRVPPNAPAHRPALERNDGKQV